MEDLYENYVSTCKRMLTYLQRHRKLEAAERRGVASPTAKVQTTARRIGARLYFGFGISIPYGISSHSSVNSRGWRLASGKFLKFCSGGIFWVPGIFSWPRKNSSSGRLVPR